jgi:hypothetical protein
MLLFQAEEDVDRWCTQWALPRGAILPLEQAWHLAKAWFDVNRGTPEWRRPGIDEVEHIFANVGLSGAFWALR